MSIFTKSLTGDGSLEEAAKRILSGETHLKEDDQYTGYNILQQAKRLAAADGKDWADVSRNEKEKQDYFAAAEKEMGLEEEAELEESFNLSSQAKRALADNGFKEDDGKDLRGDFARLKTQVWKTTDAKKKPIYIGILRPDDKDRGNTAGKEVSRPYFVSYGSKGGAYASEKSWLDTIDSIIASIPEYPLDESGLEEADSKTILVYDKDGSVVQSYAPNNIGATRNELLTQAEKLAQKIGGTVKEEAYEIGTDELSDEAELDEKQGPTAYMKKVEKAMASDTEED